MTVADGAQKLVQEVCGPAHRCAKKILWQLDLQTPLDDSEASRRAVRCGREDWRPHLFCSFRPGSLSVRKGNAGKPARLYRLHTG